MTLVYLNETCDIKDMEQLAKKLYLSFSQHALKGMKVYLSGDLGVGKTTFVRFFLQAMGYVGTVKSPTYTLVEPYEFEDQSFYHFDLYRLNDPEELESIGIRDYFQADAMCFIEWPEKAIDYLPKPDLAITISLVGDARQLNIKALSHRGQDVIQNWH